MRLAASSNVEDSQLECPLAPGESLPPSSSLLHAIWCHEHNEVSISLKLGGCSQDHRTLWPWALALQEAETESHLAIRALKPLTWSYLVVSSGKNAVPPLKNTNSVFPLPIPHDLRRTRKLTKLCQLPQFGVAMEIDRAKSPHLHLDQTELCLTSPPGACGVPVAWRTCAATAHGMRSKHQSDASLVAFCPIGIGCLDLLP